MLRKPIVILAVALVVSSCNATIPHRDGWELDPQGQAMNLGSGECQPPRVPYYIYPDGVTPVYLECLRDHTNE
jgi:hypothetical protein